MTEPTIEVIPTKGVEVIVEKVWFAKVEGAPTAGIPFGSRGGVLVDQEPTKKDD
jgi:hypothetical protein